MNKIKLNIDHRFGRLFTLYINHDYYADQRCNEVVVSPTLDTKRLINRMGLLFCNRDNESFLNFKDRDLLEIMLAETKEPLKFSFILHTKSNYFTNYTNLSFREEGEIFHYSNWEETTNSNTVSKAKKALGEGQQLPLLPPIFNYRMDTPQQAIKVTVKNQANQVVYQENKELGGTKTFRVNLAGIASGKHTLYGNDKKLLEFYSCQTKQNFPLGFLDIYANPKDAALALYDEDGLSTPTFEINFQARATRWKYLLPNDEDNAYTDFSVEDEHNEVQFQAAREVQIRDGRTFNAIYSEELLPFSQVPAGPLYLKYRKKNGKALPIKRAIPAPSFERIVPEGEQNTFCAELFIYV